MHEHQLWPFQRDAVDQLLAFNRDCLLADEPGLGKTATAIEYMNRLRPCFVLIVCPASLRLVWKQELSVWQKVIPAALDIMSYDEAVRQTPTSTHDLVIFDEAHYLKNPEAKRTQVCLGIKSRKGPQLPPIQSRRRLFLTGTPVVNRPIEMYPMLSAMGLPLGWMEYGIQFCGGKRIPIKWKNGRPVKFAWDFSGASNLDVLAESLRKHVMVRRTKAEMLTQLPPKTRTIIEIEAPHGETASFRKSVNAVFDSFSSADAALDALAKIAFTGLSTERKEVALHKLPYILDYLVNVLLEEEDKVVVMAYHREVIEALEVALIAKGIPTVKIYGGMSDKQKDESVQRFQTGDARVFAGQIQAAGVGITLDAASTVLFAELDWVPGNVIQAEDRVHRGNQRKHCRILHVVLKDSVDGRIVRALVDKQENITKLEGQK